MLGWALLVRVGFGTAWQASRGELRHVVSWRGELWQGRQVMVRPVELGLVVDWFGRRGSVGCVSAW